MKETLIEIADILYQRGFDKTVVLATINPPDTVQQASKILQWIQNNPQANPKEITRKALEISKI